MAKHPHVIVVISGVVCLTIIFVVNAFTLKVDNYITLAIVAGIFWLLGIPMGRLWGRGKK